MSDSVNHPSHYTAYPVEVIDIIRMVLGAEGFRSYCLGNEIKYRMRAGLKGDAAEDLAKALKYKEFRDSAGLDQPGVALGEAYLDAYAKSCSTCGTHPCSVAREAYCKSNDRSEWRPR